jgi:RTX calcium-binding nonapeptide repeat (4 copies)
VANYVINSDIIQPSGTGQTLLVNDTLFLARDTLVTGTTWGIFADSVATRIYMQIDGTVEGGTASPGDAGIELDGSLENVAIGKTGTVFGLVGSGVQMAGGSSQLANDGQISSGLNVGAEMDAGHNLLTNNGTIQGGNGVAVGGDSNFVINTGTIEGGNNGLEQFNMGSLDLVNSGTITGSTGVQYETPVGETSVLTNSGSIFANFETESAVWDAGTGRLNAMNTGLISSAGGYGIVSTGGTLSLTNHGEIDGANTVGFEGANGDALNNTGKIEATGVAVNEMGTGGLSVVNSGEIDGATAVQFGTTVGEDSLVNTGIITATQVAVNETNGADLSLTNAGTISGATAIQLETQAGHADSIDNTGTIESLTSSGSAITDANAGALDITNAGHILGGIVFGTGDDVYDGAQGSVVGIVNGGFGNDLLTGGAGTDNLNGGNGNDVLVGNAGNDVLTAQAGTDAVSGGAGDDVIVLGSGLDATDTFDGGDGRDVMTVTGSYTAPIVLVEGEITNIEAIRFGAGHSYDFVTDDSTVAAGTLLTVNASSLASNQTFIFDGSAETDGRFNILGGSGNDTITGGNGADTITGGAGADTFVYQDVSQSTGILHDKFIGFDATADKFDLDVAVSGINTAFSGGKLTAANFDANLAADVTSSHLSAGHAVLFTATSGGFTGHTFLVIDANGIAGYQAGQDYVMDVTGGAHLTSLSTGDFV